MNVQEFLRKAELDQTMADYFDEVAQAASSTKNDRSVGLDFMFVLAGYAAYMWLKNKIDHQRGLDEAELRRLMENEIDSLVDKGQPIQVALAAVQRVSKAVAARPPDESVLAAGLALLKGVKG
jgi:hypothetical protein